MAVNINKDVDTGEIMGDDTQIIAGSNVITDMIGELTFEISPTSFYQVNPVQVTRLYDKVREYCDFGSYEEPPVIMDLYCGVGTIGLYCADAAEAVVGIEVVKDAVINANRNAVINNIVNARFIQGKAEEILPEYMAGSDKADVQLSEQLQKSRIAIMDPPRAGSRPELMDAIADSNVDRIIYVSCDPATLGRDVKYLEEKGFSFIEATPVDMFPWTSHVETVVLMSKVNPDK